jgi:hypothetical protein
MQQTGNSEQQTPDNVTMVALSSMMPVVREIEKPVPSGPPVWNQ